MNTAEKHFYSYNKDKKGFIQKTVQDFMELKEIDKSDQRLTTEIHVYYSEKTHAHFTLLDWMNIF